MAWHTTRRGTAWNLPAAGYLNATTIFIDNAGDEGSGSSRSIAAAAAAAATAVSTAAEEETTAQRSRQQTQAAVA